MKGKFITFEGCEGVGKSTQVRFLTEYLTKTGVDFVWTREPGGTEICEKIRSIILDKANEKMSPECEALLYASSRAQLLKEVILPNLELGKLVICDRYFDSSFAYQAYARKLGYDFVANINDFAMKYGMPDLTLFLDLSSKEAFMRKGGVDQNDRMELLGDEFHEAVYNGYKQIQKVFPQRIISVDVTGTKYQTSEKIIELLKQKGII